MKRIIHLLLATLIVATTLDIMPLRAQQSSSGSGQVQATHSGLAVRWPSGRTSARRILVHRGVSVNAR